jgi:D-alanyl-lipoteichoic acid acyltransferase DltB (MBOAT superfamily)
VVAYTLQIYFDFSGYSDMAVGLSLLFGVRLPYNFNSPYQAWNITEFWRRWHMTLSRFLRDYLYVPLGGNRRGRARRYVNLMLTMLLGGLWHGASWTFVIWGGLHGAYLVVNHGWSYLREKLQWQGSETGAGRMIARAAGVALTLLCVMVGWVFFRAPDLASAIGILRSMFGFTDGVPISALAGYSHGILAWIVGFSLIALFSQNSQQLIDGHLARWLDRRTSLRRYGELLAVKVGALSVGVVLMAVAAASRTVTEFIYFNF